MKILKNPTSLPVRTILSWLWLQVKQNKVQAALNLLLGLIIIGLDLFFVYCTKLTIDIATGQVQGLSLTWAGMLLVCTILLQISVSYAGRWVRAVLGVKAQNQMQRELFQHILMTEWSGMEQFHSGDVLNRIERDVSDIVGFVTESFPNFITLICKFIGAFIFLFIMDRTLACVVIVLIPFFLLISKIYVKQMRHLTRSIRQTDSSIQSVIQESLQHRTVVKAMEQNMPLLNRLSDVQENLSKQVKRKTHYSSISASIMSLGFGAGYLFTFLWGVHELQAGTITYGSLIAFIQLVGQIQGPARSLTHYIPILISTFTATERLLELWHIPRETVGKEHQIEGSIGIRFNHVNYAYESGNDILHDLTFDFTPESCTAILGETGVGKTTLVRLLLALIHPQKGKVEIYSSKQVFEADATSRHVFSYVPQGNTLFSGTIRRNLQFGDPEATEDDMKEALHLACADFVYTLPEGIDTICGEHGYGLSEGQAQRICLARAFLRPGPVLLLDEATSALDETTELQVLSNIHNHFNHHTIIVVSHRPAVLQYCNRQLRL